VKATGFGTLKVTHYNDEHLIGLSSEEAALFVDVCHAAIFSDFMPQDPETQNRLMLLLGQVQIGLLPTAQQYWEQKRASATSSPSSMP
jgi:hypothetical protein